MLTIESNKVNVNNSQQEVFDFLADLNNLEKLMPQDKLEYWKSTDTTCRFGIKNLASIGMKHEELTAPSQIKLVSDGKNPFTFTLTIFIQTDGDTVTSFFEFEGDINMFMKAMVQKPLKQFFDTLAENLNAAIPK
jgi:carbon monoxide dehydrogenase subunit G